MLGLSTKRRTFAFPLAVLLAAALAVGTVGAEPASADPLRGRLLSLVNRVRASHGAGHVRLSDRLSEDAKRHTRAMIRQDRLFHTRDLRRVLEPYRWRTAGEVVGCAGTLRRLVRSWLRSPSHRSVLLGRSYRRIGIGVVATREGSLCGPGVRVWATAILYG